jgi:ligand-binding sensor domain-containing protein
VFTRKDGLPADDVWSLERRPEGGVWIGTGSGLARAEGETIVNEGARLGLPAAAVFHLRHDASDKLWISTARGLHYWNGTNTVSITATTGLPDEHVWCSARTPDGVIWMGTGSNGLIGYDGKAMTVLDKRDGIEGNRVFTLATEGDRSLWAGFLDGGLTRYRRSKSRPSIQLVEVSLGDRTTAAASR